MLLSTAESPGAIKQPADLLQHSQETITRGGLPHRVLQVWHWYWNDREWHTQLIVIFQPAKVARALSATDHWGFNTACVHVMHLFAPQQTRRASGAAIWTNPFISLTSRVTVMPVPRGPIGHMPTAIKAAGRWQFGVILRLKSFVRSVVLGWNEGTEHLLLKTNWSLLFLVLPCIVLILSEEEPEPTRRTINSKYALKVTERHVCSCSAQLWDKPVYWGLIQTHYICSVELQLGREEGMNWWEIKNPTVAEQKPPRHHLMLGSKLKALIAAGKMSLTYQPIPSTFILECRSRSLENEIKGLIKENYFVYLLLLLPTSPLEVAASFKSTIPIVIAASGKRLSRKLGSGKWEMKKKLRTPQDGVSDTYLHLHICLNVYTISEQEREHQLQMNIKSQPFRKRNKSSLSKCCLHFVARLCDWQSSVLNINRIILILFIKLLQLPKW